jgi:hypothetical protein
VSDLSTSVGADDVTTPDPTSPPYGRVQGTTLCQTSESFKRGKHAIAMLLYCLDD